MNLKKLKLRDIVGGAGDLVKKVAPIAAVIPGIGPVIASVAGGLGGIAGTANDEGGFNLGRGLKDGALSAVSAYGVGKLGSAVKHAGGLSQVAGSILPRLGAGQVSSAAPAATGAGGAGGAAPRSFLGGLGNLAKTAVGKNGVVGKALANPGTILAAGAAIQGARQGQKAGGLQDQAVQLAQAQAADNARFKDLAFKKLSAMDLGARPNVAGVFTDPGNAYARAA
jgi:hypothetical protein